jgi:putative ABC transport system permease protein
MDTVLQDLRFAFRSLRKQRATSAIAIVCLALGIGANTAIFTVVRTVLLDSLPYRDATRLTRLYESSIFNGQPGLGSVSVPNYLDIKRDNTAFEMIAATNAGGADLVGDGGQPERINWVKSTADLFAVLGSKPLLGRTFAPGEDEAGHNVVVLSEGFFRRRFAGNARLIGQQISLNNTPYTIIGVMPADFDYPISPRHSDAWVPLVFTPDNLKSRGSHWLQVVGRLRPGLDSVSSNARLKPLADRLARDFPNQQKSRGLTAVPMTTIVTGRVRPALMLLLAAVGMVLLIACANVANLLLARAAGRTREVAIRTALGAERIRLIRQLLTESILLAIAGGAFGLVVAYFGLRAILAYAAVALPRADVVHLDGTVLLFALVVSAITGIVFGIMPALRSSDVDLRQDLTETAGRGGTSRRQHRTLNAFIAAEIAISVVLLVGAGLVIRAFAAVISTDPGFRAERLMTFHLSAPAGQFPDSVRYTNFFAPVIERLRAIPGVQSVSMTTLLPIQNSGTNGNFEIVGQPKETDPARQPFAEFRVVGPDFFHTMGIPIKAGRGITDADGGDRQAVVVVNEAFAKKYFSDSPIGHQLLPWNDKPATIVGVVGAIRQATLEREPAPEIYVPGAQQPYQLGNMTFVISTRAEPTAIVASLRQAIRDIAPTQPLSQVQTMEEVISDSLQARKLTLTLLAVFAVLATALSAAGVYGVMSYGVAQRTREIGIRMALGARGGDVTSMVLRDAGRIAAIGLAIGIVAALVLTRFIAGMLYGVGQHDLPTFAGVVAVIAIVAVVASLVPALRASRVDPLSAMRID